MSKFARSALSSSLLFTLAVMLLSACGDKTVPPPPVTTPIAVNTPPVVAAPATTAEATVQFQANEAVGIARPEFEAALKSIVAQAKPGQVLEITGISYANEQGKPGEDLAKARAEAAGIFLMDSVPQEKISYVGEKSLLNTPEAPFGGVRFKWIDAPTTVVAAAPAPAPAPAPTPTPTPTSTGEVIVYFATGSARPQVSANQRAKLKAAVTAAQASGGKITVEGHTDALGNANSNQVLSEARAKTVKALLIQLGANADAVTTSGAGASKQIDEKLAAKNRRAEVRL